jgi:hypothetical protein
LAAPLAHPFVTNKPTAIPAWSIACFNQRHRRTILASMTRCVHVSAGTLVSTFQHILGGKFPRQLYRHAGGARELGQRPPANPVFVGVV